MQLPELSGQEIKDGLSGLNVTIGSEILFFPVTASTNTAACELAEKGQREGAVIIADRQTQGRGRRGRQWISPAGKNLYLSAIVRPAMPAADGAILTLMAAVACVTVMQEVSSLHLSIKWPNDLMVADKKIGGILAEMKTEAAGIVYAVIGIGININSDDSDLPDNIKATATSVRLETGRIQSRTLYALETIKSLDHWYAILLKSGKKSIIEAWQRLSSTIGRHVIVTSEELKFTGLAEGIDNEGALIIRLADNTFKKISAGDVTIVR